MRDIYDRGVLYQIKSNHDYHEDIKKTYLIDRIFHFRHCQMILGWQSKEPLCRTWLVVSLTDTIPPTIMETHVPFKRQANAL